MDVETTDDEWGPANDGKRLDDKIELDNAKAELFSGA